MPDFTAVLFLIALAFSVTALSIPRAVAKRYAGQAFFHLVWDDRRLYHVRDFVELYRLIEWRRP